MRWSLADGELGGEHQQRVDPCYPQTDREIRDPPFASPLRPSRIHKGVGSGRYVCQLTGLATRVVIYLQIVPKAFEEKVSKTVAFTAEANPLGLMKKVDLHQLFILFIFFTYFQNVCRSVGHNRHNVFSV